MKGSRAQNNMQNKQQVGHRPVPDIRDNIDSRSGEEQETKGDDITHNKRNRKAGKLKNRGRDRSAR